MIKNSLLIFFACFLAQYSLAQKQADWWYFGENAGLTFTSGVAQVVTDGTLQTSEGCSSMSDANGNLLFYTDGRFVYTATHTLMAPVSHSLGGNISTTQSALIIKKPGAANIYYIFTLPEEGNGGFTYSELDMSLAGGNGSITVQNTVLKAGNVTEKLSAVRHCNGNDIWVAIHELGSNAFYTYSVSSAGVNTVAIVSNVGRVHTDVHGQMKFNNNGSRIACAVDTIANPSPYAGKAYLDLLSFDNSTGIVSNSNALYVNNYQALYGLEFSQDNTKVYGTYYNLSGVNGDNWYLVQFDLSAPNILSSAFVVHTVIGGSANEQLRACQIARDGKIYVIEHPSPFISVINNPNLAGAACSYSDNAINVDPLMTSTHECRLGLPGFMTSYFNSTFPAVTPCIVQAVANFTNPTTICKNDCINFTDLSTGSVTVWNWTFPGGTPSVSSAQNPSTVCFGTPGTYTVKLVVSNGATTDSAKKVVTVNNCTVNATANFSHSDTVFCKNTCINFTDLSTGSITVWNWTFPGASPSISAMQNPTSICYSAAGTYTAILLASNGSSTASAVHTVQVGGPSVSAGPNYTYQINNAIVPGVTITASGNANTYVWSPTLALSNSTSPVTFANPTVTTVYTLTGTDANGCTQISTVQIYVDETCGDLFIPTAFSPNADGENDLECVFGSCITEMTFAIYDRWGEKVFESTDPKTCWDGMWQGKIMDTGVFVYHLLATFRNGEKIDKKGNIHLIR
jgi:gliding motility-associated-like protein